jgi:hypothetical protein
MNLGSLNSGSGNQEIAMLNSQWQIGNWQLAIGNGLGNDLR